MISVQNIEILALKGTLMGSRLLLRQFTSADISESYLSWLQDPEVLRFSNQRFRVHTKETCQAYLDSFDGSPNYFLAICNRLTGVMIGTLTVYRSLPHGTADIGILIGERQFWGQGFGAEAFCLVLSALKDSGAVRKITAGTLKVNRGMVRILEKAGLQQEAIHRDQELFNGEPVDVVYYATFCHD